MRTAQEARSILFTCTDFSCDGCNDESNGCEEEKYLQTNDKDIQQLLQEVNIEL